MMKASRDQASLFGHISPVTGEVSAHPPLCCCGRCAMPVMIVEQPAAILAASLPEEWELDLASSV